MAHTSNMSSLQFLNKKSWHVGTRKNAEQVWLREQAAKKEAARVEELRKQLDEERKLEEVRKLNDASGTGEKPRKQVIDWMYEGPGVGTDAAKRLKEAEQDDLLLGKKEASLKEPTHAGTSDAVSRAGASKEGDAEAEEFDASVLRDAEAKLREDPMLSIRQQEARVLQAAAAKESRATGRQVVALPRRSSSAPKAQSASATATYASAEHKAQKLARKAERARIREARKARREERSATRSSAESGLGVSDRKHQTAPSHGRGSVTRVEDDYRYEDDKSATSRKRRRSRWDEREDTLPLEKRKRTELRDGDPREETDFGYGLRLPAGGTLVEASQQFQPEARPHETSQRGEASRETARITASSSMPAHDKYEAMRADAEAHERTRRARLESSRLDEEREAAARHRESTHGQNTSGPAFLTDLARSAIERQTKRRSTDRSRYH